MGSRGEHSSVGLIPAAGSGSRLGRGPKAFLPIAGRTLLERSVAALSRVVDEIVVAVPEDEIDRARELVPAARVVAGGSTRQESVRILLAASRGELVLVHDAARPFLEPELALRVLNAAERVGASTAARPVADTLVLLPEQISVDRNSLRSIQTPQGFRRELLVEAHERATLDGVSATDDAGLVRAVGAPVELVDGSPWLFKVTTPEDLEFAEALAACWQGG